MAFFGECVIDVSSSRRVEVALSTRVAVESRRGRVVSFVWRSVVSHLRRADVVSSSFPVAESSGRVVVEPSSRRLVPQYRLRAVEPSRRLVGPSLHHRLVVALSGRLVVAW